MADDDYKDYQRALELADEAFERATSPAAEPFLIEQFCAEVAWMGKQCPVYPATAARTRDVCKFLTAESYENYRCPIYDDPETIYQPIIERGASEQRKALEHLADMSVRYSQNPPDKDAEIWLHVIQYHTLGDAIKIYEKLGLKEKTEYARQVWGKLTSGPIFNSKEAKEKHRAWQIAQIKIDEKEFSKTK